MASVLAALDNLSPGPQHHLTPIISLLKLFLTQVDHNACDLGTLKYKLYMKMLERKSVKKEWKRKKVLKLNYTLLVR